MSVYARRGPIVRLGYLAIALAWWPVARLRARLGRGADPIVLCYHNVRPEHAGRFRRQVERIADRAVALGAAARRRGRPAVALTFDDGFADLLEHALPRLADRGVPATLFAVTGAPGDAPGWPMPATDPDAARPTMSPDELRRAAALPGITIGAHTCTHPDLTAVDADRAAQELRGSRAALEAWTGRPVVDFAFPHGRWSPPLLALARAVGFRRCAVLEAAPGPAVVRRIRMEPDAWPIEFRLTVDGAYAWLPALRRAIARRRRAATPAGPSPIAAKFPDPALADVTTGRRAA